VTCRAADALTGAAAYAYPREQLIASGGAA
jgi:hypothetical protein